MSEEEMLNSSFGQGELRQHAEAHRAFPSLIEIKGGISSPPNALATYTSEWDMAKISVPRRFLEGEKVEVKQREKGLRGAWFEAVIVGVLPGKRIVEYDELLTDDGSRKLRETIGVSALFDGGSLSTTSMKSAARTAKQTIRPRPKPLEYPRPLSWLKGMWVDCWYEDAWWEGILVDDVTSTDAMEGSHLILTPSTEVEVDFPAECEILKIPIKDMRLTQDFQDGGDWSLREADLSGYRSSRLGKRKAQMD